MVATGADVGLALDGDADRLVAVDHTGALSTGDELLALFATDLAARRRLAGNAVVVTVMTNLGFRHAMARHGIEVRETQVGDRYVLEALDARRARARRRAVGPHHLPPPRHDRRRDRSPASLARLVRRSTTSLAELPQRQ